MHTIYVLGNPLEERDNTVFALIPHLQKMLPDTHFTHIDPTEEWPDIENKKLILIDVVHGVDHISVFHDIREFADSPRFTVHDFDLTIALPLLIKLKKITSYTIIGIPQNTLEIREIEKLANIIKTLSD